MIKRIMIVMCLLAITVFSCALPLKAWAANSCPDGVSDENCQSILGNWTSWETYDGNSCSTSDTSADDGTTLSGADKIQQAFNYFKGLNSGLTDVELAAIVGAVYAEHSLSTSEGGLGGANGIAQWEGGRWTNLKAYATAAGEDSGKLSTQLEYVAVELGIGNTSIQKGFTTYGAYSSVITNLQKQSDLTISDAVGWVMGTASVQDGYLNPTPDYKYYTAAKADQTAGYLKQFMDKYGKVSGYENPGAPRMNVRVDAATTALKGAGDSTTTVSDTTTTDTSSADCSSGGNGPTDGGGPAKAGSGYVGNCDGQGSFAPVHCGQCVDYVEWVLENHADPSKGPYNVLTDQSGPDYHAAESVTKNLGAKGFTVNSTPAVHATFTIPASVLGNGYGHTGMVSEVTLDSGGNVVSIGIEQSNWPDGETYSKATLTEDQIQHYQMKFAHTEAGWHD